MALKQDLVIRQGADFTFELRWAKDSPVFKLISAISQAAPALVTAPAHGIPNGWPIAIRDVVGMHQINNPGGQYLAEVVDSDSFSIKGVSSLGFGAYVSGGVVEYLEPMDLSGCSARLQVRQSKSSASTLISLDSQGLGGITLNNSSRVITVALTADQTADLSFDKAVYDLEIELPSSKVERLLEGGVTLSKEVTR